MIMAIIITVMMKEKYGMGREKSCGTAVCTVLPTAALLIYYGALNIDSLRVPANVNE